MINNNKIVKDNYKKGNDKKQLINELTITTSIIQSNRKTLYMGKIYLSVSESQKPLAHIRLPKATKIYNLLPNSRTGIPIYQGIPRPNFKYPKTSAKYMCIYIYICTPPIFYVGGLVG